MFTLYALWVATATSAPKRIEWHDIVAFESPITKALNLGDTIVIVMRDGTRHEVRVAGSYGPGGKYKDYLHLVSVLLAIVRSDSR
jgi:hypothetical protein